MASKKVTHVVYRHTTEFGKQIIHSRCASLEGATTRAEELNAGDFLRPWRVADVTKTGTHELLHLDAYGWFLRPRSR